MWWDTIVPAGVMRATAMAPAAGTGDLSDSLANAGPCG